jgi:hypothetical protein
MGLMKLLALKPVWWNVKTSTVSLYDLPDVEWPLNRILKFTCRNGHQTPDENCTCGVRAYPPTDDVCSAWKTLVSTEKLVYPTLMVVQLLGTVLVDPDKVLRAEKVFVWGIVKPYKYNATSFNFAVSNIWEKYDKEYPYGINLAKFFNIKDAANYINAVKVQFFNNRKDEK